MQGAYCNVTDLRYGDIPLPAYVGDGSKYVLAAAEEIDAQLGHIYVTPIVFNLVNKPQQRPSYLLIKKINWLLASGRLVIDLAAAGENTALQAYGEHMLKEALGILLQISQGDAILDADLVPESDDDDDDDDDSRFTGPIIFNADSESLVESFYNPPVRPYVPKTMWLIGNNHG